MLRDMSGFFFVFGCFGIFKDKEMKNQPHIFQIYQIKMLIFCFAFVFMHVEYKWCVVAPVSGWMLNAGTVESLCMKPYVTLPLEPSSASTAWTCRTNVPAGWFSRTDVLSLYCWHWPTKDYSHVNTTPVPEKSCDNPLIPLDIQFKQTQQKDIYYYVPSTF